MLRISCSETSIWWVRRSRAMGWLDRVWSPGCLITWVSDWKNGMVAGSEQDVTQGYVVGSQLSVTLLEASISTLVVACSFRAVIPKLEFNSCSEPKSVIALYRLHPCTRTIPTRLMLCCALSCNAKNDERRRHSLGTVNAWILHAPSF